MFPRAPYTVTNQGLELRIKAKAAFVEGWSDNDIPYEYIMLPLNCTLDNETKTIPPIMLRLSKRACNHFEGENLRSDLLSRQIRKSGSQVMLLPKDIKLVVHTKSYGANDCGLKGTGGYTPYTYRAPELE